MNKENLPKITSSFLKSSQKNLSSMKKYLSSIKSKFETEPACISMWDLKDEDGKVLAKGLVFLKEDNESGKKKAYHKVKHQMGKTYVDNEHIENLEEDVQALVNDFLIC